MKISTDNNYLGGVHIDYLIKYSCTEVSLSRKIHKKTIFLSIVWKIMIEKSKVETSY